MRAVLAVLFLGAALCRAGTTVDRTFEAAPGFFAVAGNSDAGESAAPAPRSLMPFSGGCLIASAGLVRRKRIRV